jgi:hypothetical protein
MLKIEQRENLNRALLFLAKNPAENSIRVVKAVAQAFMLGENLTQNGASFEPQSKHLGTGVYQISYKKTCAKQIIL